MTAIIWAFFIIMNVWVMYWYAQNRDAVNMSNRSKGLFAMRKEKNSQNNNGQKDSG